MFSSSIQEAVAATQSVLDEVLGEQLAAIVIHGDLARGNFQVGESAVEMLVLIEGPIPWDELRLAFRPVWEQHQHHLRQSPCITDLASWERHTALYPNFVFRVENQGQCLTGSLPDSGTVWNPAVAYAEASQRALTASAALAPQLLYDDARAAAQLGLRQLARDLTNAPVTISEPVELFGLIQAELSQQAAGLDLSEPILAQLPDTPPDLPELRAIYEKVDQLILALPELGTAALTQVDWPEVADRVAADYGSLHLCTPLQLQSIVTILTPAALLLQHYENAWGNHFLSDLVADRDEILVEAARNAAKIHLEDLPAVYLRTSDDDLGKLVHDFQNKLLNIQLQHELLHRLLGLEKVSPDKPLVGRGNPYPERVSSTLYHLNWWCEHYRFLAQPADLDEIE